jgi:hypothetical protein
LYRQFRRRLINDSPTEFQKRIQNRWEVFWRDANDLRLIDEKLSASDSIAAWTNIENWQRRLENKYNAKQFAKKMAVGLPKSIGTVTMRNSNNKIEILIEEFLQDELGQYVVPNDFRFFTFNGNILFIQLDKRRSFQKEQVSFYSPDWKLIRKKILKDANVKIYDEPPTCLPEMIEQVRKLSEIYKSFVRIDFYATSRGPVFGEFTATPRRGKETTRYGSKKLIESWDTYCKGMI